jgi:Flp pilus assembly pilin Flp
MRSLLKQIWSDLEGQDIAEYAVLVGAILVSVLGLMRAL